MPPTGPRPITKSSTTPSQPTSTETQPISRLDILDCHALFAVVDLIRQYKSLGADQPGPAPSFDYRICSQILEEGRSKLGFQPTQKTLAFATVDPDSEGQARFLTALTRLDILVEPVDFRDATVTLPLVGDGERSERRYLSSLAPNIAFMLGLMVSRPSPEVVVVTRAFELYWPLRQFVENRGGKAAIAFFRRFLDPRFAIAGLFDSGSPVKFIDLDTHSEQLVGYDVRTLGTPQRSRNQGASGV